MTHLEDRNPIRDQPPTEVASLERRICAVALEVLQSRILDSAVTLEFVQAWWTRAQNTASGCIYWCLNLEVQSNSPDLVRGSLNHLGNAGVLGYNTVYLQGYLDALLGSIGADFVESVAVQLSVIKTNSFESPIQHPRYLPLSEALSQDIVDPQSPITFYSRKYNLEHVAIFGPGVIGPTTEMIAALEHIWPTITAKSVLDLFAGTGSLGSVCRALGAESVVSVERVPPPNMQPITDDFRSSAIDGQFDLALVDQFVEDVVLASEQILPRLAENCRYVLWNLGTTAHRTLFGRLLVDLPMWTEEQTLDINDCQIVLLASKSLNG